MLLDGSQTIIISWKFSVDDMQKHGRLRKWTRPCGVSIIQFQLKLSFVCDHLSFLLTHDWLFWRLVFSNWNLHILIKISFSISETTFQFKNHFSIKCFAVRIEMTDCQKCPASTRENGKGQEFLHKFLNMQSRWNENLNKKPQKCTKCFINITFLQANYTHHLESFKRYFERPLHSIFQSTFQNSRKFKQS